MSSSTYSTHNLPPHWIQRLPYPETPWRASPSLQERIDATPPEAGRSYKKCEVLPTDPEWGIVVAAFSHQKPLILTIDKVYRIHKSYAVETFVNAIPENRRKAEDPTFQLPVWSESGSEPIKERWQNLAGDHAVTVLPLWHGSQEETIHKICDLGFSILGRWKSDPGYFGRGIYFTTSPHYGSLYTPDGHLLLSLVQMRKPHLVNDTEYKQQLHQGKPPHDNQDANYIPVISTRPEDPFNNIYLPAEPEQEPMCDEIVVFTPSQTLPLFWVKLKPDLPISTFNPPQQAEVLFGFILGVLQLNETVKVLPLLKELSKLLKNRTYPSENDCSVLIERYNLESIQAISYIETLVEALGDWKKMFAYQELFKALPAILELFFPEDGWEKGCDLLLPLLSSTSQASCDLLKRFLIERSSDPFELFAFQRLTKAEGQTDLVQAAVFNLLKNSAPDSKHEELFKWLSVDTQLEPLRVDYLSCIAPGPLFDRLALIPNRDGYRQFMRLDQENLQRQIERIVQTTPTAVQIKSPFFSEPLYLKEELIEALLDPEGNIRKKYLNAQHHVSTLTGPGFDLHFKQKPSHPMEEYGIYSLSSRLIGEGVPPTFLVRFDVNFPGKKGRYYPVLISKTIQGQTLKEILEQNPEKRFSPEMVTPHLLLSLLIRPGDGRDSNYVVSNRGNIYCVDNDCSFVFPLVSKMFSYTVNFKSILYCLPTSPLHLPTLLEWSKLSPDLLLAGWIGDLEAREALYASLFSEQEQRVLYQEEPDLQFTPLFISKAGLVTTLYVQLLHLLNLHKQPPENGLGLLKHLLLLDKDASGTEPIGERLHRIYQKHHLRKGLSPNQKLQAITNSAGVSISTKDGFIAKLGRPPTIGEIEKRELYSLEKLKREFFAFTFFRTNEVLLIRNGENSIVSIEVDFSQITKEGRADVERQELILKGLEAVFQSEQKPQKLTLLNCPILTEYRLLPLLHPDLVYLNLQGSWIEGLSNTGKLPRLKELVVSRCPKLGRISVKLPLLEKLESSHCSQLTDFTIEAPQLIQLRLNHCERLTRFGSTYQPIRLPSLKTFDISHCPFLREVILQAPELEMIQMDNNPILKKLALSANLGTLISLDHSPNLNLTESGRLTFRPLLEDKVPRHFIRRMGSYLYQLYKMDPKPKGRTFLGEILIPLIKEKTGGEKFEEMIEGFNSSYFGWEPNQLDLELQLIATLLPYTPIASIRLLNQPIDSKGFQTLGTFLADYPITQLRLENVPFNIGDMYTFIPLLINTCLTHLTLKDNRLNNEALVTLIELLSKTGIIYLDVGNNLQGWDGVLTVAKVLPGTKIQTIFVERIAYSKVLNATLLKEGNDRLDLTNENITDQGVFALSTLLPKTDVRELYLKQNHISDQGAISLANILASTKLEVLSLADNPIGWGAVGPFISTLRQSKIKEIDLGKNCFNKMLAPLLPRLEMAELDLSGEEIGDAGAKLLVDVLRRSEVKLERLKVSDPQIGEQALRAIIDILPNTGVVHLELENQEMEGEAVDALCQYLKKAPVTFLGLKGCQLGDGGVQILSNTLPKTQLQALDLRENGMTRKGASALSRALPLTKISRLNLGDNPISQEPSSWIHLKSASFTDAFDSALFPLTGGLLSRSHRPLTICLPKTYITDLDLSRNQLGDVEIKFLAKILPYTQISKLKLAQNPITWEGVGYLADVVLKTHITEINLGVSSYNTILEAILPTSGQTDTLILKGKELALSPRSIEVISRVLPRIKVKQLDLSDNNIVPYQLVPLNLALPRTTLTSLILNNNRLGESIRFLYSLSLELPDTNITHLSLRSNRINGEGVKELAERLAETKLSYLDLSLNDLGDTGAKALAAVLPRTQIEELLLSKNSIGRTGACVLASALPSSLILKFDFSGNEMGWGGLTAFAGALPKSKLTELILGKTAIEELLLSTFKPISVLDLSGVRIDTEALHALGAILSQTKLRSLYLSDSCLPPGGKQYLTDRCPPTLEIEYKELQVAKVSESGIGLGGALLLGALALFGLFVKP